MSKPAILWVDLEMTGLDAEAERIIEIAAIVTDWKFNELDTFELVVKQPAELIEKMVPEVVKMHTSSGLITKIASGESDEVAEARFLEFIDMYFDEKPVLLAGNSIHQDRRFIRRYWPKADSRLHYRMLDVSAWKVVFAQKYGIRFPKRNAHRALDDIRGSIEEMHGYLEHIKP
ncbi:oligoribonuclease [Candidatus Saccharibacteria bacterium]|jgi:oligoribonuclease|nr:oligoribonuclease [Candidatus Saccharibacteria bacterium]MBP9131795.1 oligoribonuclease [Candidatus Saccharibacteria bacterium]